MRSCAGCQSQVPDDSETCPRCGALVPRGLLGSLRRLFQGSKPASGGSPPVPASQPSPGGEGFRFTVEDVFSISGRGTIVTGRVGSGEIRVGDEVRFRSAKGATVRCRVIGLEMMGKRPDVAKAGDSVGLLLSTVEL